MAEIKALSSAPTNYLKTASAWLRSIPPLTYLAKPILQMSQLVTLTAPTNAGKSAATAMIICACLGGLTLGGITFKKGKVLALLGENAENFRIQLKAAALRYGVSDDDLDNLVIYEFCKPMERTLMEVKNEVLQKGLGPFVLVSIDTVAAYFGGEDENSNAQIRRHAALMREFCKPAFGSPCVLANSHPTKAPSRDNLLPRGGGALVAEIDSNLTLWNDDGIITIHYTKLRGIPFDPVTLHLSGQSVGFSDGSVTEVAVAGIISETEAARARVQTRNEDELLMEAIKAGPDMSKTEIAKVLGWLDSHGKPYINKVVRALKRMEKEGKLRRDASGNYTVSKRKA